MDLVRAARGRSGGLGARRGRECLFPFFGGVSIV